MFGNDLHFHAALFIGALDRLQDHIFSRRLGEDRDGLTFLDQSKWGSAAGLAHRRPRKRHHIFDGFRRPHVGGKARRGIFAFLLRVAQTDQR